jgi:hypothetical protein
MDFEEWYTRKYKGNDPVFKMHIETAWDAALGAKRMKSELNDLLYAETDDGVKGTVREKAPEYMKMDNGLYFVPIDSDALLHREVVDKLLEAIDNHYPDSPEFAVLYSDAKEMIGI